MSTAKRKIGMIIIDVISINISLFISLLIKFDMTVPVNYINHFVINALIFTIVQTFVFVVLGLYNSLWEYAGIDDILQIFIANSVSGAISCVIIYLCIESFSYAVYINAWILTCMFTGASRLSYRFFKREINRQKRQDDNIKKVMIVGAGSAGSMIIKEMKNHPEMNYLPVIAIDDNQKIHHTKINGIEVAGGRESIVYIAEKYEIDEIIIALPSAKKKDIATILQLCKDTKCKLKKLPGIYELLNEKSKLNQLQEVNIEDLLGRNEVELEIDSISGYLKNEVVLVTGGGGSIGSELCRQIARFGPKKLIIFDIYENNAYELQNELIHKYKEKLDFEVLIGSCRDRIRLREVFEKYRPGVIFHAAAHKHVPLMETSPCEAIKNNVFGTLNTARRADDYKAKKFILVSTDKAVNPTNIMGASKRLAEIIIQSMNRMSQTKFAAVRFGNVLGSNGSVIPLFNKQIKQGGPVLVTHPEIIRYFMTIQEAAKLVIQAGALTDGGEVFILDMGEPVKIVDLARDLIKLSGLEPGVDIEIEYTGLRPGEKLYEELLMAEEGIKKTSHEKIFIGKQADMSFQEVISCIKALESSMENDELLRDTMTKLVPTYKYSTGNIEKRYKFAVKIKEPALGKKIIRAKEEKISIEADGSLNLASQS